MWQKRISFNSIRSKLIISLISICVIPLLIVGILLYNQSKVILNKKLSLTSEQTLSQVNDGITDYVDKFRNIVILMSSNYDFVNVDTNNNFNYVPDLLKCAQESDEDILSVYYGTVSGKFAVYPNLKLPDGFDATKRPWYKQALANRGKTIITSSYKDALTGKDIVTVACTVENNGQVVGVVGMNCTLSTLANKIADKKIGNSGYVFIADASGKFLAHPDKKVINTYGAAKLSFWNKAKLGGSGFIEYTYNGVQKFGAYETNKLTGWRLIATLPESELKNDTGSILMTTLLIILAAAFVATIVSFLMSKGMARNIKKLQKAFRKASSGDLSDTVEIESKDEFGELGENYNFMMKNIGQLLESAKHTSNTVLDTSSNLSSMAEETNASMSQVAVAVTEISQGANNLADNAQETSEGIGKLSQKLDNIEKVTHDMNNVSQDTKELSKQGIDTVNILINKNSETMEASAKVADIVFDMDNSVKEISIISDAINEITEQTNLLSLNASIEAARAGEAGKGFAVVADEIRKLAEESKGSTEKIKVIIENIQLKAGTAVQAMEDNEKISTQQNQAVEKTEKIFTDILLSVTTLNEKVEEVKKSIESMQVQKRIFVDQVESNSSISEETASSTEEVSASTQEVTATMDQFTEHTSELQELAKKLQQEINKFKI
ncbi:MULTISPECIES: methyl-accepting chemotaxis protein [Clostridium]|uniref:methyl-accepting chemotaxis protein n=1 Tax=Clostridium TaxID=1485 RepID=UPI0008249B12|nr:MULTISPECIES: methyl-accepting chemotaxis protein [Clostridium]PJI09534.1 chemotaxis protein [Clostridium sp. CT7]